MRLLTTDGLLFEDFFESDAPAYAILSHRWQKGEVGFKDMNKANRKGGIHANHVQAMLGYKKIQNCARQALRVGLKYIWVDTCCIDKTSSAELQESINSMFNWYKNAAVCFAYLSDVPSPDNEASIMKSKWFTRGWTLQELLAPKEVLFFDRYWQLIGTRSEMRLTVGSITKIQQAVLLRPDSLRFISIANRLSWAAGRQTTRKEDQAYCLLGICGINMSLLYGEGSNAFLRLQQEIMKISNDTTLLMWDAVPVGWAASSILSLGPGKFGPFVTEIAGPLCPSLDLFKYGRVRSLDTQPDQANPASQLSQHGLELVLPCIQDRCNQSLMIVVLAADEAQPRMLVQLLVAADVAFSNGKKKEHVRVSNPLFVGSQFVSNARMQHFRIPRRTIIDDFHPLYLKLNDMVTEAYTISFCYPPQLFLPYFHSLELNFGDTDRSEERGTRIIELLRLSDTAARIIVVFDYVFYNSPLVRAPDTSLPLIITSASPLSLESAQQLAMSNEARASFKAANVIDRWDRIVNNADVIQHTSSTGHGLSESPCHRLSAPCSLV